mgnify:CR=1 FL=1
MFPVTDEYLAAQRAPFREERITGTVQLRDGTFIAVSNDTIVQGSLSITRQAFRSDKFDIGMLSSAVMNIRIKDDRAYDHEFSGARVSLVYGIVTSETEDGTKRWYSVPLPPFYVDGHGSRQRNFIKLTAYDPVRLLSVAAPGDIPTDSLYAALSYVCGNCGVTLGMMEKEFELLPNSGVIPDFSSESIETCADVVMWIAQTVNCCAFCNYSGQLVLRQYYYEGGDNYDYLFTAARRTKIEYGDTRTYLAYLQSYVGSDVKIYSNVIPWTGTDAPHTKEGSMALPKNPVLKNLTADQQDEVNRNYLALKNRGFATRYVKSAGFVDPALEPLDVVAFSGGSIDVGQIISVATKIVWKFRGNGTVYCTNVTENGETASSASEQSGGIAVYSAEETTATQARISPKSQLEKRMDELEGLGGTAKKLQTSSSSYYADTYSQGLRIASPDNSDFMWLSELKSKDGFGIVIESGKFVISGDTSGIILSGNSNSSVVQVGTIGIWLRAPDGVIDIQAGSSNCRLALDPSGHLTIRTGNERLEIENHALYFNGKRVLTEE